MSYVPFSSNFEKAERIFCISKGVVVGKYPIVSDSEQIRKKHSEVVSYSSYHLLYPRLNIMGVDHHRRRSTADFQWIGWMLFVWFTYNSWTVVRFDHSTNNGYQPSLVNVYLITKNQFILPVSVGLYVVTVLECSDPSYVLLWFLPMLWPDKLEDIRS